ncbi:MAG: transposase [Pseudodesulfovibrio sp.]
MNDSARIFQINTGKILPHLGTCSEDCNQHATGLSRPVASFITSNTGNASLRILSYYDHPISSDPIEGANNKIETLKQQAYEYRDKEYL